MRTMEFNASQLNHYLNKGLEGAFEAQLKRELLKVADQVAGDVAKDIVKKLRPHIASMYEMSQDVIIVQLNIIADNKETPEP